MTDALLLTAALIGVAAAAFLVARSPAFWWGMALTVWKAALPSILKAVAPRERTQEEKDRERAGQTIFGDRDRR